MKRRSPRWLTARAQAMRKEMTPEEKAIWHLLHDGELVALNWRRQTAFGTYVLDFVSHAAKLVIEIDGAQHAEKSQLEHDACRSAWLNRQGYCVLRVWNNEAVKEKEGVWRTIHAAACKTRAMIRMQRWREKHMACVESINAEIGALPLDGGGGREADGGGARAGGDGRASRGNTENKSAPHPLSHAAHDSSPIEGERE